MKRRTIIFAAGGLALPAIVRAQGNVASWPDRPIRFVVPFAPGGNTDSVGRIAAQYLGEALGRSIVVENRGGAGGIIGSDVVAKSAPDGYTFLVGSIGSITISPAIERMPYDPLKDLAPVSLLNTNPLILVGRKNLGLTSVQAVVARAKEKPESLTYGSSGIGGLMHVSALLFESRSGAKLTHVPYRGGAPAVAALLSGEVDLVFANMSDALPQVKAGSIIPIGVTTPGRSAELPEVPTVAEAGVPGFATESWNGLFAPATTSPDIVSRLSALCARMAADATVRQRMASFGSVAVSSTPEEFGRMLREETAQWATTLQAAGLSASK
ncbi:Tripartite-type tricarboxylate transporter, receptor component TctC [Roseomonas rosea]|uniref:Tripartite-type tricarboxylate transporter, receptor component TctC n=1 Tax=Muricoccus roseus TaxID=198092 RepID=A0A1M6N0H5_9PROT|nr:tripartite tricarboxylate transporter substrate binding protein [Roseomonas rosea]SHJ89148.1 Tripartite-type tricarboxylate transporter, receptor component TctC [Roseomonas rosea]